MRFAVFDGNSWHETEWYVSTFDGVFAPVALRVHKKKLHCAVVHADRDELTIYALDKDGDAPKEVTVVPSSGAFALIRGVAMVGSDLYVEAFGPLRVPELYATSLGDDEPWELVDESDDPSDDSCRSLITQACSKLSTEKGFSVSAFQSRATLTAFRGKAWCVYDAGAPDNSLLWQTYALDAWSPVYRFGDTMCGVDPALCLYGDLLYCFHRGEDGEQLRWCATDGLSWSVAHDTGLKSVCTPAVRAFQGKLYCAYVPPPEVQHTIE
ncbi:MAG: hypothetical protein HOV94_24030 [Saccharothrix sp.]|nr:hypothetical protein [Saccharothrix sp.]